MKTACDFITELLQREHTYLLHALSQARSEHELQNLSARVMAFASSLLVNLKPIDRDGQFMGVPFRLSETPELFWSMTWPGLCTTHGIEGTAPKSKAAEEKDWTDVAEKLKPLGMVLLARSAGDMKVSGPILTLDLNLTNAENLISFLFQIVLRRAASPGDFVALSSERKGFDVPEARNSAIDVIFTVILLSEEARQKGEVWKRF